MLRFAANLSTMYGELPFENRFSAAAKDGFTAVEYMFPFAYDAKMLAKTLREHNLTQALFNVPAGNFSQGERGLASLPGRQMEFIDGIKKALEYADILQCKCLHILCGNIQADFGFERQFDLMVKNVSKAAELAAPLGVHFTLEAISKGVMPAYILHRQEHALRAVQEINMSNVGIQFDIYHCQMTEGNIKNNLLKAQPYLKHIQVAGVPERHEPQHCELDFTSLFSFIEQMNYEGYIGCEYSPQQQTNAGLTWFTPYK